MGYCSASVNLAACLRVCLCSAHSLDKDDNGLELVSTKHTAWLACCDNEKLGI
jgi:predicted NAD/FAD-dependent oxidoreductase